MTQLSMMEVSARFDNVISRPRRTEHLTFYYSDTPESIGIFIATAESPQITTSIIESGISTVGGISTIDTFNPQATVIGLSSSSNSRMSQSSCIGVVAGVLIGVVSALASVCLL